MDEAMGSPAEPKREMRRLGRHLLLVLILFSAILGALFAYAGTTTPLYVVESSSMQHGREESHFGVLDTGDLFIGQAIRSREDVLTYVEGRAGGYSTYGDYGDVIVFQPPGGRPSPFVHRAIAFVVWNATSSAFDVRDLARLPDEAWDAWDASGAETPEPFALSRFVLHRAGWRQDLDVYVNLTQGDRPLGTGAVGRTGFLTMGDDNAYTTPTRLDPWVVPLSAVLGRARGEIPWFGLIRLTLFPSDQGCCNGWGSTDPNRGAPANSWTALDVSLGVLFGMPIVLSVLDAYLDRHPEKRERWRALGKRILRRPPGEPPSEEGREGR